MKTGFSEAMAPDRAFHALADEKRLLIVDRLRRGECCVCDLAKALQVGQSLLSFHLKTLKDAGIVRDRRDGRWVHYALVPEALSALGKYVADLERSAIRATRSRCCRHGGRRTRKQEPLRGFARADPGAGERTESTENG
jgi:ArsR family transcriptional regulator